MFCCDLADPCLSFSVRCSFESLDVEEAEAGRVAVQSILDGHRANEPAGGRADSRAEMQGLGGTFSDITKWAMVARLK